MLHKRTLAIAASLGLATMSPIAAFADETAFSNAPVSVSACETDTTATAATASTFENARLLTTTLHYRFVNNAGVDAGAVVLDVSADGQTNRIVDRGTFAPGVAIDRDQNADEYTFSTGKVTCRVTRVDFRDGTSWHAAPEAKVTARR